MSDDALKLEVPAEPPFEALAAEVAGKYLEVLGAPAADVQALAAAVVAALEPAGHGAGRPPLTMDLSAGAEGVAVRLRSADWSTVVKQPLPVRKS